MVIMLLHALGPILFAICQIPDVPGKPQDAYTMRWIEVAPGTGAPAASGKLYRVHYTGWLADGKKFDSSLDRNEPIEFVQGRRQVIAGWDSGFEGMRAGGKRRLIIPYQLAYGEAGRGAIPPKAELTFDVELLAVEEPPAVSAAQDVLTPLRQLESKYLALAEAIPEDKYDWRPSLGMRSIREVLLHAALANQLLLDAAGGRVPDADRRIASDRDRERLPESKQAVIDRLKASFATVRAAYEGAATAALGRDVEFFGRKIWLREVYVRLDVHLGEHLGQLIAYARANGIRPPWSGE